MSAARALPLLLLAPWLLAADAREVARRDGANLQRPLWSPDGTKLAYEANFHDKKIIELYAGDPKTGAFSRVVPVVRSASAMTAGFATSAAAKGGQVAHELDWAPASIGRFVYSASNEGLDYDLYLGLGGALAAAPGADGGPSWSPDGRYIAFTSARTGQGDLYLLDVNAIEQPPRRVTTDPESSELFVSWSPDGQRFVFCGHSKKGDNLWLLPALTQTPVKLTDQPNSQVRPSWSPAGDKIAYYANVDDEQRFDLYVIDATPGATPTRLLRDVVLNAGGPTWTPDGKHVVVALDDDDRYDPIVAISVADPTRTKVLDFGTVGHSDLDITKAPDGKWMIALVAQGKKADKVRDYDRLFVAEVSGLP